MKSLFKFFIAATAAALLFASCDKNDEGDKASPMTVTASNVTEYADASGVTTVRASTYGGQGTPVTIAQTPYSNKGFSLVLPAECPAEALTLISQLYAGGFNISDPSAKGCTIATYGYDSATPNPNLVDEFHYTGGSGWKIGYLYVDRPVTISGSLNEGTGASLEINISAKTGWNIIYINEVDDATVSTSTKPSGITFQWVFGTEVL